MLDRLITEFFNFIIFAAKQKVYKNLWNFSFLKFLCKVSSKAFIFSLDWYINKFNNSQVSETWYNIEIIFS